MKSKPNQPQKHIITAIQEGLADVAAGRTKPAKAAILKLAKKFGMKLAGMK